MPIIHRRSTLALLVPLALIAVACSDYGGGAAASLGAASVAPSSSGGRGADYGDPGGGSSPSVVVSAAPSTGEALELGTGTGAAGTFLTRADGRTLYIFTKDSTDTSVCADTCAENWPPLTVPSGTTPTALAGVTGTLTTFTRADGSLQVAYDGKPLYAFIGDKAAGDTNGQGVNDVWFIAEP